MRIRSILLVATVGLVLGVHAKADVMECLDQAQHIVQPDVWQTVSHYFASLNPRDPTIKSRSRLLELKSEIVHYESAKQQLIEILEAHINEQASGAVVSQSLQVTKIPELLARINRINGQLKSMSNDHELFVAEKPFKDLVMTFDEKRATTLCELKNLADAPVLDTIKAKKLVQDLKTELKTISDADDALGNYIKALGN
jgi:hypothetical protein